MLYARKGVPACCMLARECRRAVCSQGSAGAGAGVLYALKGVPACFMLTRVRTPALKDMDKLYPGNTKGGSITVQLTSCLTGLD